MSVNFFFKLEYFLATYEAVSHLKRILTVFNSVKFTVLKLVLLTTSAGAYGGFSSGPIPFEEKFERQSEKGFYAWENGDQIRAPFRSDCTNLLLFVVAEGVPGGVDDSRHADQFNIIAPSDIEVRKIKSWQGRTFEGVVEVVHPEKYIASNMQQYSARIVSLAPPQAPVNPNPQELKEMNEGEEVIIQGIVTKLDKKSITVNASHIAYDIQLSGLTPLIDGDFSDRIRNLTGKEHVELGDMIQLKSYKKETGGLRADWCYSCYLIKPSEDRYRSYRAERKQVALELNEMKKAAQEKDWKTFRKTNSRVIKKQLTPKELERHENLFSTVPFQEQPLRIVGNKRENNKRAEVTHVNEIFEIDVDEMTQTEFLEFLRKWAANTLPHKPYSASRNEDYLFRVMEALQVPGKWMREISQKSILTRLQHFEDLSANGHKYEFEEESQESNLLTSLTEGVESPTPESVKFMVDIARRIANNEIRDWGYKGQFTTVACESIKRIARAINKGEVDMDPELLKPVLKNLRPTIEGIHSDLLAIGLGERPVEKITVIGLPEGTSSNPYQSHYYSGALNDLERAIEIIKTW